jgi:hypothetical protein
VYRYATERLLVRVINAHVIPKNKHFPSERSIELNLPDLSSRTNVRAFVNSKIGTLDLVLDGVAVARVGREPDERIPNIGDMITIALSTSPHGMPTILSNLRIRPWSGELPPGDAPGISLANGDVSRAAPGEAHDGKIRLSGEVGDMDVSMDKIQSIDFGGAFTPKPAAGRIYLPDGTILNVDGFRFGGNELTAHSQALGDLRLPANALSELILEPALPRAPHVIVAAPPGPSETLPANPPPIP